MSPIEKLEAALAAATPGEWRLDSRGPTYIVSNPGDGYVTRDVCRMDGSTMASFNQRANAELLVLMKNNLPALIEAAKTLARIESAIYCAMIQQDYASLKPAYDDAQISLAKLKGE